MKSSPIKIKFRQSPYMQVDGGVGGRIPIDPDAGEGSVDPKVGRVKQSDIDYSKETEDGFETVASIFPISGEVIDAKNVVKDLINKDYGGAALNAAGFMIPFVPGSVIKGGVSKVMNFLRKQPGAEDAIKKGEKILEGGGPTGSKPRGGVDGGGDIKVDMKHENLVFHNMPNTLKAAEDVTKVTSARGVDLDNFVSKLDVPTAYTRESVTKLPSKGTRDFVKVDLPNKQSQIFYKSSGTGRKAGSKGEWIPFEGHRSDGWYIKTGSRGKFHGKDIKTIFTHHNAAGDVISKADWIKQGKNPDLQISHGVYEQVKKLGLDPWKEVKKGNLKLDHYGQGFKYGSEEYVKIAEQLKNMDL